jgi:transforming growth factor-beta-induced protein
MKNLRKYILKAFFLVIVLSNFSCEKKDKVTIGDNIDKTISDDANYSIFNALLARTKLDVFSKGGGPFTIFAPSNAAFVSEGFNNINDLALLDSATLNSLAAYHIQAGARTYTEIIQGSMGTISGFALFGTRLNTGEAFVNGVSIIGNGTSCSNGVLYKVNKILRPAFATSTAANILTNNNGKLMVQAASKTLVSLTANPSTIFAIPNTVMISEGYDSTTIANLVAASVNYIKLQNIIRYHIVAQRSFAADLKSGNLKTVQGGNILVSTTPSIGLKGINNPSAFTVSNGNLITTTGVVHFITGMLKP